VSVQVEALADEVFAASAAHARAGADAVRRSFGEVVSMPGYPDLAMVNVIGDLVAPDWTPDDLTRVIDAELPTAHRVRITSRDAPTIAALGPRLVAAGYRSETRIAMLQVSRLDQGPGGLSVTPVDGASRWAAFDALNRMDAAEQGWSAAMTHQLLELCHWRAAHTPHRYYLAWLDDRPVAYLGVFQHGMTAYLHSLFTQTAARHQGFGSAITLAAAERARDLGCDRITLECAGDSPLPAFYARLGFRPVGTQQHWTRP
jgi:GNAT superfamily N-acetyltransferase